MQELTVLENEKIENMIYEVRGKPVMFDSDLARLYNCANGTKAINLAVKRNVERFPEDFYFQLTKEEYKSILSFQSESSNVNNLKFQNETSSLDNHGGVRKLPYVFTEQGVAMLATVLKTSVASQVSVNIMRAFVLLRKYASNNLLEQKFIHNQVLKNTEDIRLLQESFSKFEEKRKVNEIYFNGQIYDAYSKILDIFNEAESELIVVDAYIDKSFLDIIRNLELPVKVITSDKSRLTKMDIDKYNSQYNNLEIIYDNTFHDRYFILDRKKVYHSGTSLNYIGRKTFSINKIEDKLVIMFLIEKITRLF